MSAATCPKCGDTGMLYGSQPVYSRGGNFSHDVEMEAPCDCPAGLKAPEVTCPVCNGLGDGSEPHVGLCTSPAHALAEEVKKLRRIIADARYSLRIPRDPDCPHCFGDGTVHHVQDDLTDRSPDGHRTWESPCNCDDPFQAAMQRQAQQMEAERAALESFRRDHGHEPGERCTSECPLGF